MMNKNVYGLLLILLVYSHVYAENKIDENVKMVFAATNVENIKSQAKADIFNVKTLSDKEFNYTNVYSADTNGENVKLIFSDVNLPVFILGSRWNNTVTLDGLVKVCTKTNKLYARMLVRDRYYSHRVKGDIYELSIDGTNAYRKVLTLGSQAHKIGEFDISPNGEMIIYGSGFQGSGSGFIRNINSGELLYEIDTNMFKSNYLSGWSWSHDSKYVLFNARILEDGDCFDDGAGENPQKTTGSYFINVKTKKIVKLFSEIGYLCYPNRLKFLKIGGVYKPRYDRISPDENFIAFPGAVGLCFGELNTVEVKGVSIPDEIKILLPNLDPVVTELSINCELLNVKYEEDSSDTKRKLLWKKRMSIVGWIK